MTSVIRECQRLTGFPRFKFINEDEMAEIIRETVIPKFTESFPYKTIFCLYPDEDEVDPDNFPGLFKIVPKDAPIEKIYDCGMVYSGNDIAMGGYPRDLGRTVYGGSGGLGAVLYNQISINMMSMMQPQQLTCEYIQPNYVQLYPKRRFFGATQLVCLELLLYHSDDLATIPNSYGNWFKTLSALEVKRTIYERYKDYEDDSVAGHSIRTKVQEYSGVEDKIDELLEKMSDECFKNPDRTDYFYVI